MGPFISSKLLTLLSRTHLEPRRGDGAQVRVAWQGGTEVAAPVAANLWGVEDRAKGSRWLRGDQQMMYICVRKNIQLGIDSIIQHKYNTGPVQGSDGGGFGWAAFRKFSWTSDLSNTSLISSPFLEQNTHLGSRPTLPADSAKQNLKTVRGVENNEWVQSSCFYE